MHTRLLLPGALALALLSLVPTFAAASSHRESYTITKDPTVDNTDVYAFVSPDKPNTVTLIANFIPFQEPSQGPNFYNFDENATYFINVDNVGDARPHVVFEFKFATTVQNVNTFLYNTGPITSLTDPDFNLRQTYTVTRWDNGSPTVLGSNGPVPPANIGPKSTPDYANLARTAITTLSDGSMVFAGPRDDPFFLDTGAHFDLLTVRRPPGNLGGGIDGLGGFNVHTIALQVPKTRLTRNGAAVDTTNSIIGVWSTTTRSASRTLNADGTSTQSGPGVQVSRLGNPLVNEEVIPRKDKDRFNASLPQDDGQFLPYVLDPEPARLIAQIVGISVPPAPRNDLVAVFLTGIAGLTKPTGGTPSEELRLNMAIAPAAQPKRLGVVAGDVAGFPNGRRLADDAVDIALRALAGGYALTPAYNIAPNNLLGDGVNFNDRPFLPYFPYISTPHQGFCHQHHLLGGTAPTSFDAGDCFAAGGGGDGDDGDDDDDGDHDGDDGDDGDDDGDGGGGGNGNGHGHGRGDGRNESHVQVTVPQPSRIGIVGANPSTATSLEYSVANAGRVKLAVYDVQGRLVRSLVDQDAAAGTFSASWDGRTMGGARAARGLYFARYSVGGLVVDTKRILLQ